MERKASSHRFFTSKPRIRPIDQNKKTGKTHSKGTNFHRQIPKVIMDLQKNIQLLKKYYEEEELSLRENHSGTKHRLTRPKSSTSKRVKKVVQEETTMAPELEDVKKSFLSANGYDSNNVVQLYNFYKKNIEKSTRIFGSISGVNSTHNFSDINKRPSYVIDGQAEEEESLAQNTKRSENKKIQKKQNVDISNDIAMKMIKNNSQLVNVASLLADRRKISRENISHNINSESLNVQAKKKLSRTNRTENIQILQGNKENQQSANVKITSPSLKSNRKQINCQNSVEKSRRKSTQKSAEKSYLKGGVRTEEDLKKEIADIKAFSPIIKEEDERRKSGSKNSSNLKESQTSKSLKSAKSIRSPLNQGLIFECGEFGSNFSPLMKEKGIFKKAQAKELTESLLDCEISVKQNSRNLDLEQIPFQF